MKKNVFIKVMVAVMSMCFATSCNQDSSGLTQGHKLDPDEVVPFEYVTKQAGEVVWLANGEIYASSKFEGLSLEGKAVSFMGTRPMIYRYSHGILENFYFEGHEIKQIINQGRATRMKIVTSLKSKGFGMTGFALIFDSDNNRVDIVKATVYQMVEK